MNKRERNRQKAGGYKIWRKRMEETSREGERERKERTWGLDQGPNHSTTEYVWK